MKKDKEYYKRLVDIYCDGGYLWLVERGDTGEFYNSYVSKDYHSLQGTSEPMRCGWTKVVDLSTSMQGYLTKKDAEKDFNNFISCPICGYDKVPSVITEHQFK